MSITKTDNGRLCNQIIRNLALSILAKKYNLYVEYSNYNDINNKLGIELFVGNKKYDKTILINNNNYIDYFNNDIDNNANFDFMKDYFQNEEISTILHNNLMNQMKNIIEKNPYKERYNNNNDIFLHIRIHNNKKFNLKIEYYIHCINLLKYDNIYIGTDNFNDDLIKSIKILYPNVIFIDKNPIETIQFGSTCKNIILSYGSFSAVIGYLGFFSNIYFMNQHYGWGDKSVYGIFLNKGFIPIDLK
jgi:hypothetical protein